MAIKTKMPEFPDVNELWEQLDVNRVHEAIHSDKMMDHDLRDARALVVRACEAWLPRDYVDMTIDEVEARFDSDYRGWKIKGFKDLGGTMKGTIPVLSKYKGYRFILDWKTTKNRFTTEWTTRLLDSWQWKMYTTYSPTDIFIFRGINRYGDTKEVMQLVPKWEIEGMPVSEYETRKQLDGIIDQLEVLEDVASGGPWLRNMPSSCYAFKKKCPFYENSCEAADFPYWNINSENRPAISYSLMNDFMLCQERLRRRLHQREVNPEARDDETEHSRFGNAIHRGLAEVYTQLFDIEREEEKHAPKTSS